LSASIRANRGGGWSTDQRRAVEQAATTWSQRITLPGELRPFRNQFVRPLARLIAQGRVAFYESLQTQGQQFTLDVDSILNGIPARAFNNDQTQTTLIKNGLRERISPLLQVARQSEGAQRDESLNEMVRQLRQAMQANAPTQSGRDALERQVRMIEQQRGTRGGLPREIAVWPNLLIPMLNAQAQAGSGLIVPSLTVVIGESEQLISSFARQLIEGTFEDRRTRSLLYPAVSFVFDEADVFVSQAKDSPGSVVEEATLLARRGRKFGLGLGIATQRIRYLNTSIMAQPHTYFISKLPRKSDRDAVTEAFAISEESLEQSFGFSVGQWLIASHDATGLRSTPFPVQLPNANAAVREWLQQNNQRAQ
jgi:hypothetical protein